MFDRHPIPYQIDDKESILHIGPLHLSLDEMVFWGVGLFLSYLLMQTIPPIGGHIVFSHLHQFIPFYIAVSLAHLRYGGMLFRRYALLWLRLRLKRRLYLPRHATAVEEGVV